MSPYLVLAREKDFFFAQLRVIDQPSLVSKLNYKVFNIKSNYRETGIRWKNSEKKPNSARKWIFMELPRCINPAKDWKF